MTDADRRVPLIDAPLTGRTIRFREVYEVCAAFEIDCFREAAETLDRLKFIRGLVEAGRLGKGDWN